MKKYGATVTWDMGYCGTEESEYIEAEFDDDTDLSEVEAFFLNYAYEQATQQISTEVEDLEEIGGDEDEDN